MNTRTAAASKAASTKTKQPNSKRLAPPAHHEPVEHSASEPVAEAAIQLVELGNMIRAPENVRHTDPDKDISGLADDIAAHGLLQSLIGYRAKDPRGRDAVFVVGGGRRHQALNLLEKRGAIGLDYRVPVLIRDRAEAVELSLSENLQKRDMNPADEFEAFTLLMRPWTMSPEDLAKRFGFTTRYVKQRLRLAELAPEILEALRRREITIDTAMAYASSQDRAAQLKCFKKQAKNSWKPHDPDTIRRDLTLKTHTSESAIAAFVGLDAYEAAGGRYDDDLFSTAANPDPDEPKKLIDGRLLEELASKKMGSELIDFVTKANREGAGINAGALIAPDLEVWSWQWTKPKPPEGFALVECNYDREKRWNAARNCGAQVKGIVGLDASGEMILVDSAFFVSKDKLKEVVPPIQPHQSATPEQIAARQRVGEIEKWSRRLAIEPFAGITVDGLISWPPEYERSSERMVHPEFGEGYAVSVRIFVTKVAADAQIAAAEAKLDAIAAEKKAAAEAEERRKAGLDEKHNLRVREIADMKPEPAVVFVDDRYFFRWADGSYNDAAEDADFEPDYGFDELTQLLADAETLGDTYVTVEEFDAAQDAAAAERETAEASA